MVSPLQLFGPLMCAIPSQERRLGGWSGPRAGPGLWLSSSELAGSWPVPSLSPLPLTPKLLLQPLLTQSSLSCTPRPRFLCPQRRSPAAHCQVQRIKITSGKTRGSRSNINLRDLAYRPRRPFPGSLPTNMQLLTAPSPRGHPLFLGWTLTHKLQQEAPTHLRARGHRCGQPTQTGDFGEAPPSAQSGVFPEASGGAGQPRS